MRSIEEYLHEIRGVYEENNDPLTLPRSIVRIWIEEKLDEADIALLVKGIHEQHRGDTIQLDTFWATIVYVLSHEISFSPEETRPRVRVAISQIKKE